LRPCSRKNKDRRYETLGSAPEFISQDLKVLPTRVSITPKAMHEDEGRCRTTVLRDL